MRTHKRPISPVPSKLLTTYAEEIAIKANGPIADIACGYGRNAKLISSFGAPVICVDIDQQALDFIKESLNEDGNLLTVEQLDLINDHWPFENNSLGAIINVHFFTAQLLEHFKKSLKLGGYLFLETIDGHGKNYLDLPPYGFIRQALAETFDIKYIKENKTGPDQIDAATVKLLAIKRRLT
ncbi:class I SAM-dependent methyltransferase [Oryzomonas rubra]|uniref:Class I SAM-dependent methyltransferase n=1 Tax=Oryzomonas rubra TaxID=2509454 RepID=A0A5A9XRJ9_9BACT|nr:class I SAM-dependent methyltransferase [Oryzomonas rubra]KAA0894241.1 class I SAM-dependent methyltransferase [Oryzomonas rubra]